jgi:hypothetical protein
MPTASVRPGPKVINPDDDLVAIALVYYRVPTKLTKHRQILGMGVSTTAQPGARHATPSASGPLLNPQFQPQRLDDPVGFAQGNPRLAVFQINDQFPPYPGNQRQFFLSQPLNGAGGAKPVAQGQQRRIVAGSGMGASPGRSIGLERHGQGVQSIEWVKSATMLVK